VLGVFDAIGDRGHEEIVYGYDPISGLKTIIAIHSTALGPALGGTRFYPYESEADALEDVLRLSEGMTFKAAAAGLDLGGGKAVIIGDHRTMKSERLWRAYGRVVDSLQGRYITAEDVGTDAQDMETIRKETRWVLGVPVQEGGSGDPSPATARGIAVAMQAVAKHLWGDEDLAGRHIAVMGVGKVGRNLVGRLLKRGARVTIADTYPPAIDAMLEHHDLEVVDPDEIYRLECDILSPNSLGGSLNEKTIPELRCQAIAGAVNNQLLTEEDADRIAARDILYAPDFVINAGGLINVYHELRGYNAEAAKRQARNIYGTCLEIFEVAERDGIPTQIASDRVAEKRIAAIKNMSDLRKTYNNQSWIHGN